jgi:hypothetical protein
MIVVLLIELRDQLIEVVRSVREELVESVFLALRIVASHQSHRLAEAWGHGIRLVLRSRLVVLPALSLVVAVVLHAAPAQLRADAWVDGIWQIEIASVELSADQVGGRGSPDMRCSASSMASASAVMASSF